MDEGGRSARPMSARRLGVGDGYGPRHLAPIARLHAVSVPASHDPGAAAKRSSSGELRRGHVSKSVAILAVGTLARLQREDGRPKDWEALKSKSKGDVMIHGLSLVAWSVWSEWRTRRPSRASKLNPRSILT
jgi:hypothetical protein